MTDYLWIFGIIIDVVFLGILLLFYKFGAKAGFAKTVMKLCSVIIAFVLAVVLSKYVANFTYDKIVKPSVSGRIETAITKQYKTLSETADSEQFTQVIQAASKKFPAFVRKKTDTQIDDICEKIKGVYTSDVKVLSENITETVVRPFVIPIVTGVAFLIVFVVAMLVCLYIASLLKIVNKVPLLGKANMVLGGVMGVLRGAIVVVIVSWILLILVGKDNTILKVINYDVLHSSLVVKNLEGINPLADISAALSVLTTK